MANREKERVDSTGMKLSELRGELWVIIPFFALALFFFLWSFTFKRGASEVPMIIGAVTTILTGMRLYHILFPQSKIGQFKESGLAGEFDHMLEEIEEEVVKDHHGEPHVKQEVTFAKELKAFIGIIISFILVLLFGYIVGSFLIIVVVSYYYGYKEKLPIAVVLVSLFLIVYVVLYKLLEAPADFGILLEPILNSLELL
jgi:hypothetical protein